MIEFNVIPDIAVHCVSLWGKKNILSEVTLIRDVYGKLSFLMDNIQSVSEPDKHGFISILTQNLGIYFSGKIYWKKLSPNKKNVQMREEIIVNLIEHERTEYTSIDGITVYISERAIAKKAWIRKQEIQASVWPYEDAILENGTKVVTFYSFKGGHGQNNSISCSCPASSKTGKKCNDGRYRYRGSWLGHIVL